MNAPLSLPVLFDGLVHGSKQIPDICVSGIAQDSRDIVPGSLFLACAGIASHGAEYLGRAVANGAAAVAWQPTAEVQSVDSPLPAIAIDDLNLHAGIVASRFYGNPSGKLNVTGITGTDGKTSVAHLLAQARELLGEPCFYIGTLGKGRLENIRIGTHTTPDACSVQVLMAKAHAEKCSSVAMEVSSHALDQARVVGVQFSTAVLTNIGRDHLDYHGDVASYAAAKRKLFSTPKLKTSVINIDDVVGAKWAKELENVRAYSISHANNESVSARLIEATENGLRFELTVDGRSAQVQSRLIGLFNVYNLLATAAVLYAEGKSLDQIAQVLTSLSTVPGRMEAFNGPKSAGLTLVDYAHTPQALEAALNAARAHCRGALHVVFGCGGDRDTGKRALMGECAAKLADRITITNDNPRSEDPQAIATQILVGAGGLSERITVELDRFSAIDSAISAARQGDVVLVAGKGHEVTQTIGSAVLPCSDRAFVAERTGAEVRV